MKYLKQIVKRGFYTLLHLGFTLLGRISSLGFRSQPQVILVTGVPGYGGGPFTFLKFLLERLQLRYTVVCSFQRSQVQDELVRFCESRAIPLVERPDGGHWRDLAHFGKVAKEVGAEAVLINVGTFSQCFHLLPLCIPTVYYSHSIWHHPLPPELAFFLPFFGRHRRHHILTVSKAAKVSLDEVYFRKSPASPVSWVHNGLADRGGPGVRTARLPLTVLTLGSVAWYKNPELWVRVAHLVLSQVPAGTVRFVWAGRGDLYDKLAVINDEFVQFVGFEADPDRLLSQADVYFQPSQFESFGLGVCEAMMFGLPVVASQVGALGELIEDGVEGFLVPVEQEESMAKQLVSLLRDDSLRTSMGIKARARFLQDFTEKNWDHSFREFWEHDFVH